MKFIPSTMSMKKLLEPLSAGVHKQSPQFKKNSVNRIKDINSSTTNSEMKAKVILSLTKSVNYNFYSEYGR